MSISVDKAAKIIKREVSELIDKMNNMKGSQYYFNCYPKGDSIDCIYTDGDGGGVANDASIASWINERGLWF